MDANVRLASQFQALADPIRLRILQLASRGLPSATDLNRALEMSQPRVAHHLKVLVDAGLLHARRDGRFVRYALPADTGEALLVQAALDILGGRRGGGARSPVPGPMAPTPVRAARAPALGPAPNAPAPARALQDPPRISHPPTADTPAPRPAPDDEEPAIDGRQMEDFLL